MLMSGDVLAVVSILLGVFLTTWAAMAATGLLFPEAANRAKADLEARPGKAILRGLLVLIPLGLLSIVLISNPLPLAKLLGWILIAALLAIASVGAAGVARKMADRIHTLDESVPPYAAYVRSCAILVGGTLLPILGWFAFAPLVLIASLGAGWTAVRRPKAA